MPMAFVGFFAVKRNRVRSHFQDNDPKLLRWGGRVIIAYCIANFVWLFGSHFVRGEVIATEGGYVFRDSAKHVLGPATLADFRAEQGSLIRTITAFMMMFSGLSLWTACATSRSFQPGANLSGRGRCLNPKFRGTAGIRILTLACVIPESILKRSS